MTTEQFLHCPAHLLRLNPMLSSSEEAAIRSSYWETNSSISRLDVQIQDLLFRRRTLCDRRQMLAALLSPVRRLPPELLAEIFRYCLPQNYHKNGAHKAVMLPSHVCKHWRDVAVSTPILWTNIVLRVNNKTSESRAALVTTWFSRSGSSPLSFTLKGQENVLPIITLLLQYCNRWQYIDLRIPSETLRCLEAAKGHLQCLETIRINDTSFGTPYSVEHILKSAPRLQKVSLSGQLIWNARSGSWDQLTQLDVGHVPYMVGDCLALLQSMKSLQKLRIYIGSGVIEGHHRFDFSHLVSLCILGTSHQMLWDHITLPNLRDLSVNETDSEWSHSEFISFLERSLPPIQYLSFGVPPEVDDTWNDTMIQILQHTPSLHSLCLVYPWCEDEGFSFECLSPRILDNGQVHCLIPKLNTISIRLDCQVVTPDYRALKEMVVSRGLLAHNTNAGDNISCPIERIQKVEVRCSYDEDFDSVDDMMWHKEVSDILAPLQEVVDVVQVFIY